MFRYMTKRPARESFQNSTAKDVKRVERGKIEKNRVAFTTKST